MLKRLKLKIATRRIQRQKARADAAARRARRKKRGFWARVWGIICWPFVMIKRMVSCIKRNMVGMLNMVLLGTIIGLFSMLIFNLVDTRRPSGANAPTQIASNVQKNIGTSAKNGAVKTATITTQNANIAKNNAATNPVIVRPVATSACPAGAICKSGTIYGDVVIDGRTDMHALQNGAYIRGNVYLQNMRQYTLPCNIQIDGHLFLRDVGMVHFCGDFTITGNIYVSPRSSFGRIPRTARLGGYVIL